MGFKVRCRLVAFAGDEDKFPCHFNYKIGDEFIFDGEKFIGRICPGLFNSMAEAIRIIHNVGNKYHREIPWRYTGLSTRDPSMVPYNRVGFRMLTEPPEGSKEGHLLTHNIKPETEKKGGWMFACADVRTSALFLAEPYGLAELGQFTPYYLRQMNILEKIKARPGISKEEIFDGFSKWEREVIYPVLTPLVLGLLLDELVEVNYIEIRDGKIYPKNQ